MKTAEFLDLIERWGVMPPMQVADLRKQVATSEYPVHPVLLARRLVEEGYINSYFAKTLLEGGPLSDTQEETAHAPPGAFLAEDATEDEDSPEIQFDDLDLPPIEGADWLTRSADLETVSSLPSLAATTTLGADGAEQVWWKERGPADLPWWVIGLVGAGMLVMVVVLLLVLIL